MANGTSGSNRRFQISGGINLQPNLQAAQAANNAAFSGVDNGPFRQLTNGRQYFNNQNLTIDQQIATINYLSDTPERGSLYSMSQNMNYALANGQKLTANQQYVYDNMMSSMHNLGQNTNLTRYDHGDMVQNLLSQAGITKNHANMTDAELSRALVGMKYSENKLVSASYNDFANAPANSKSVFQSREVKINYKAKASAQAMMPGNGPGGALAEIVLADSRGSDNYEVLGIRRTGTMARRKGTQSYSVPQIEIDVLVS